MQMQTWFVDIQPLIWILPFISFTKTCPSHQTTYINVLCVVYSARYIFRRKLSTALFSNLIFEKLKSLHLC